MRLEKLVQFHHPVRALLLALAMLVCGVLATFAVNARGWFDWSGKASLSATATQQPRTPPTTWHNQLALQPEADRQRRRLGERFFKAGKEISVLTGTLTIGAERSNARIMRIQDIAGESLSVGLNGGAPVLVWNGKDGARTGALKATGTQRSLLERIALDSPDQFILAQQRGASYFTVAQSVRPEAAGGDDKYSGPVWDLVRVAEPASNDNKPESEWRLYYLNNVTGLIDKVVSQEQGGTITAEFSDWVTQNGELIPTRTVWKQNDKIVMELALNAVSQGPKQ